MSISPVLACAAIAIALVPDYDLARRQWRDAPLRHEEERATAVSSPP